MARSPAPAASARCWRCRARRPTSRTSSTASGCAAHAEEFIATQRRGFDMPVGDKGTQLSGGQKQRLSIARAFLKNAPILILDEPTASLDTISEQAVLAALEHLQQGRTTFVIAH